MPIHSLSLSRFRNLDAVELRFSPQLNLFVGDNAAGKTSLLEALFVLARGRSFRSAQLNRLIQYDADSFQIVAHWSEGAGRSVPVGIQKRPNQFLCRIDGASIKRLSDLALLIPVHWLGGNLHTLVEDGPAHRRQFVDWGLFHVKHDYIRLCKRFNKLLKQRNAALRLGASAREVQAWDPDLAVVGERLHEERSDYLRQLIDALEGALFQALSLPALDIRYKKGWKEDQSYLETLRLGLQKDRDARYTRMGPQRAELIFACDGRPAGERLSRGQQKITIAALQAAQSVVLHQRTGKVGIFLFDDLGSELDVENQRRCLAMLAETPSQVFVTIIDSSPLRELPLERAKRFHVKHGDVLEVV